MLCLVATTTRQVSLAVSAEVLTAFDRMAHQAALSRSEMFTVLVARAEHEQAIQQDAAISRRTGGDPDAELDAWVAVGPRHLDVD